MKNVIFDLGNVLIRWNPDHILKEMGYSEETISVLKPAIFTPERWEANDIGKFTSNEYAEQVCKLTPEHLHKDVFRVMNEWYTHLPPIDGMAELIRELKAKGFGIYLLSNIAEEFALHTECVPAHECFDGMVLSGVEKAVKPSKEIFERLVSRYGLNSSECVFIDDREENIKASESYGISGYLFDGDKEKLKAFLMKF